MALVINEVLQKNGKSKGKLMVSSGHLKLHTPFYLGRNPEWSSFPNREEQTTIIAKDHRLLDFHIRDSGNRSSQLSRRCHLSPTLP